MYFIPLLRWKEHTRHLTCEKGKYYERGHFCVLASRSACSSSHSIRHSYRYPGTLLPIFAFLLSHYTYPTVLTGTLISDSQNRNRAYFQETASSVPVPRVQASKPLRAPSFVLLLLLLLCGLVILTLLLLLLFCCCRSTTSRHDIALGCIVAK